MKYKSLRGMPDFLPAGIEPWQRLEAVTRDICRRFGYREIRTPILEPTDLFIRTVGETTDIVEKEMYTFEDRKGHSITLRPEGTASVVRAALQHHLVSPNEAVRLFYIGPMFRYERPQKGRQRQFHQIGAEFLGQSRPEVDAEIIDLLMTLLAGIGIQDLELHLNSLGCPNCRPAYREKLVGYLEGIKDRLCPDCQRRFAQNPLRVFDCKAESCHQLARKGPVILEALCEPCRDHFEQVEKLVKESGRDYTLNPYMVRGLDYYSRTAFEVTGGGLGAQDAVAGGGRYDGLADELGGKDVPGIGFAAGMERIVMLMAPETGPDNGQGVYVAILPPAVESDRLKILTSLRKAGLQAVTDYEVKSLKTHFKRADRWGCRWVAIVGGDEFSRKAAAVRDLAAGAQEEISLDELAAVLAQREKSS